MVTERRPSEVKTQQGRIWGGGGGGFVGFERTPFLLTYWFLLLLLACLTLVPVVFGYCIANLRPIACIDIAIGVFGEVSNFYKGGAS